MKGDFKIVKLNIEAYECSEHPGFTYLFDRDKFNKITGENMPLIKSNKKETKVEVKEKVIKPAKKKNAALVTSVKGKKK